MVCVNSSCFVSLWKSSLRRLVGSTKQSAVWHYHGYWFRIIKGKIRGAIEESLKEFERWLHWPTAKKFNKEEFLTFRNDGRGIFEASARERLALDILHAIRKVSAEWLLFDPVPRSSGMR